MKTISYPTAETRDQKAAVTREGRAAMNPVAVVAGRKLGTTWEIVTRESKAFVGSRTHTTDVKSSGPSGRKRTTRRNRVVDLNTE